LSESGRIGSSWKRLFPFPGGPLSFLSFATRGVFGSGRCSASGRPWRPGADRFESSALIPKPRIFSPRSPLFPSIPHWWCSWTCGGLSWPVWTPKITLKKRCADKPSTPAGLCNPSTCSASNWLRLGSHSCSGSPLRPWARSLSGLPTCSLPGAAFLTCARSGRRNRSHVRACWISSILSAKRVCRRSPGPYRTSPLRSFGGDFSYMSVAFARRRRKPPRIFHGRLLCTRSLPGSPGRWGSSPGHWSIRQPR
jgi:hypothetical protein